VQVLRPQGADYPKSVRSLLVLGLSENTFNGYLCEVRYVSANVPKILLNCVSQYFFDREMVNWQGPRIFDPQVLGLNPCVPFHQMECG
jgi:hypothetical protein